MGNERDADRVGDGRVAPLAVMAQQVMDMLSHFRYPIGAKVRKVRGSQWSGLVVGYYSTLCTPEGYCVESAFEPGSVQVWPAAALADWDGES